MKKFFEEELIKVEMESGSVHTYYMYVKPLNEGFIISLISLSSLLASIF